MRRLWLLLPIFAAAMSGCTDVIVGGRNVKPPHVVQKVVSLSPSTSEIIALNGRGDILKGRTAYCDFPGYLKQQVPVVGGVKPYYEKIAQLKPDLIVLDGDLYGDAEIQHLRSLGDQVMVFKARTIDDYLRELKELSVAIQSETFFTEYVDKVVSARETAQASPVQPAPKVAALSGGNGSYLIAGTKSFIADEVKAATGSLVGPDADRFVPMNPEVLVQANPDVIVLAVTSKENEEMTAAPEFKSFMADPRFASVSAVKSKRVFPVDAGVLLRRGGRVDKLITGMHTAFAAK